MAQPVERKLQFSIYSCSGEVRRPRAPAHARAPARPAHAITPAAACTADVRGRACAQDPAYPAAELLRSGADARGWQSPKCAPRPPPRVSAVARPGRRMGAAPAPSSYSGRLHHAPTQGACTSLLLRRAGAPGARGAGFPVELAVALAQPAHLERVQILSHEFKVRGGPRAARRAAPAPSGRAASCALVPVSGLCQPRPAAAAAALARGCCGGSPGLTVARSRSQPAPASRAPLSAPLGAAAAREKAVAAPMQPGRAQIAERLELFAGVVPPGGREPHWQRLGSIGLDPNARSGYQVRLAGARAPPARARAPPARARAPPPRARAPPACAGARASPARAGSPRAFAPVCLYLAQRCAPGSGAKRARQPASPAGLTRTASRPRAQATPAGRPPGPPHPPDCRPMAALRCAALPYNPVPYARAPRRAS